MPSKTVVEQLIIEIAGDSKKYLNTIRDIKRGNKDGKASMKDFAKAGAATFATIGASATALGVKATNAFKQFETGVVNVAKTTNLAGKDLDNFKDRIILMSEEIPVTTDKLLEIATAAGQLGIKGAENLSKFTEVIAKLGATTDVEGNDAALAIARILNLTNESIDSVDKLGSTLVDLGNNFAASESEILEVAKDVAKATVQFGLASDEILGISASMASLGIAAEAGGTVVGKAFQSINEAIRSQAGPAFDKLIELTDMTGDQLTETFQTDAATVFTSFIKGLGKAAEEGKDTTKELQALGLSGIRVNKILPTMATRSDILADAMERAGIAAKDASALNDEATKAFETANSRLIISQNKLNNLFIEMGETITPELVKAIEEIVDVVKESQPVVQGLAESFAFVVTNSVKLIGSMQEIARRMRIMNSMDEALNKSMAETSEEEAHLDELLKKRGITIAEFRKEQKRLAEDRKKSAEQSVKDAEKEASAQTIRTSAFMKSTSAYVDSEEEKKEVLTKSVKVRKEIEKNAANKQIKADKKAKDKLIDQQLAADSAMFEDIESMSDDAVAEYQDRQKKILDGKTKFNEEFKGITDAGHKSLSDMNKAAHAEELQQVQDREKSIGDVEAEAFRDRENARISKLNKFLADEQRFGASMARLKDLQRSTEFVKTKEGLGEITKLIDSENDTLKGIGKAATIIQMTISTAEGAMKAYNSLSWIPYVGVGLGLAAAGVVTAYGVEQVQKVAGMQTGGIVPGVGTGDKVPTLLEPGELVVPRNITKEILNEYGARKMASGGKVAGDQEKTDLHTTFAGIFRIPQIFKAILGGKSGEEETNIEGFGGDAFNGMMKPMLDAIQDAVTENFAQYLKVIFGVTDLEGHAPIDPFLDFINTMLLDVLGPIVESDIFGDLFENPLAEFGNSVLGDVANAVDKLTKGFVGGILGFQGGGLVPGMLEPGESIMSKKALKSMASGVNMSQNLGAVSSRPSIQRSTSTGQGGVQSQIIGVEISMNENAAEVINAQIREGSTLGTLKPA